MSTIKKTISIVSSLLTLISAFAVVPITASADTTSGNYTYRVLEDDTVRITRYNGNSSNVIVPDTIDGHTVSELDGFNNLNYLSSITIGSTVKSVDAGAFVYSPNLSMINVDSSNTYLKTVDGNLYSIDGSSLIQYAIGKTAYAFKVPDGVKTITDNAFRNCKHLSEVTVPDSVTTIGSYAFSESSITNIILPDSVRSIDWRAFDNCANLESATLPNGIKSLEKQMFRNCKKLQSITIPDGVTIIDNGVFYGCENLNNIEIPNSVVTIDQSAFDNCPEIESVTIPCGVKTIGAHAFGYNDNAALNNFVIYGVKDTEAETYADNNGFSFVSSGSHSWNSKWSSNASKHWHECTICGIKKDENTHNWNDFWSTDGNEHWHECKDCGAKNNKENHSWKDSWTTDDDKHWHECTVCLARKDEDNHNWNTKWSSDKTNHWHECADCHDKKDVAKHEWSKWITDGEETHSRTCVCDEKQTLLHKWDDGEVTTPPTCTQKGEKTYTCTDCGGTKKEDIDALNHDYQTVTTPPTCTNKGYTTYTCSRGDDEYKADYVNALGHLYGKTGDARFTCKRCGAVNEKKKAQAEAADKKAAEEKAEKEKAAAEFVASVKTTTEAGKLTIKWHKVKGAQRYVIYATYCGKSEKNKYKKIKAVKSKITKLVITKLNGEKLNDKNNVKFFVVAQKKIKGKYKDFFKTSKFHVAGINSKNTNAKDIKLKKSKFTLNVKNAAKISAAIVPQNKNKKPIYHVAKFRYYSSNSSIAKVDKKGKITAKSKGTATIFVYANNGFAKAVKVTVK